MPLAVAYQGEPGAYSEAAARKHVNEAAWLRAAFAAAAEGIDGVPCLAFADVVDTVAKSGARLGILPVENSLEGNIDEATDALAGSDLHVVGETELRVRHCLLAAPGTTPEDIVAVHSHPQGLRQCRQWLARYPDWRRVPEDDTAGAARIVAGLDQPGHAAIASRLAGETYGLHVLAEGIEDTSDNHTRFLIVARDDLHPVPDASIVPPHGPGYKTSLYFALRDQAGALYEALGRFASHDVNLTKIESRPRRAPGRRWDYAFHVDLEGHAAEPEVASALAELARTLSFLKVLGSYPQSVQPDGEKTDRATFETMRDADVRQDPFVPE